MSLQFHQLRTYTTVQREPTVQQSPARPLVPALLSQVQSVSAAYCTDFQSTPTSRLQASTPDNSVYAKHSTLMHHNSHSNENEQASHGLRSSLSVIMPIHAHFFRRVISTLNPLKRSSFRWLHFEVFNVIQV